VGWFCYLVCVSCLFGGVWVWVVEWGVSCFGGLWGVCMCGVSYLFGCEWAGIVCVLLSKTFIYLFVVSNSGAIWLKSWMWK